MSCVVSEKYIYKPVNGNNEYELKAFGIDDKFTFEITRSNPYNNHDYQESMQITKEQVKILINQLKEFINQ